MFVFYMFCLCAVIGFVVTVTVGDDLEALWNRILDIFHPTDRALRNAYQKTRQVDYRP